MCWCLMDRCVCVQECPFDLFGWVFLVRVVMYRFVCTPGIGTCMGIAVCLVSVRWFLLSSGSCFLYFMKVMALFSNSPSNDNSVQNCKTVLHILTS